MSYPQLLNALRQACPDLKDKTTVPSQDDMQAINAAIVSIIETEGFDADIAWQMACKHLLWPFSLDWPEHPCPQIWRAEVFNEKPQRYRRDAIRLLKSFSDDSTKLETWFGKNYRIQSEDANWQKCLQNHGSLSNEQIADFATLIRPMLSSRALPYSYATHSDPVGAYCSDVMTGTLGLSKTKGSKKNPPKPKTNRISSQGKDALFFRRWLRVCVGGVASDIFRGKKESYTQIFRRIWKETIANVTESVAWNENSHSQSIENITRNVLAEKNVQKKTAFMRSLLEEITKKHPGLINGKKTNETNANYVGIRDIVMELIKKSTREVSLDEATETQFTGGNNHTTPKTSGQTQAGASALTVDTDTSNEFSASDYQLLWSALKTLASQLKSKKHPQLSALIAKVPQFRTDPKGNLDSLRNLADWLLLFDQTRSGSEAILTTLNAKPACLPLLATYKATLEKILGTQILLPKKDFLKWLREYQVSA